MTKPEEQYVIRVAEALSDEIGIIESTNGFYNDIMDIVKVLQEKELTVKQAQILLKATSLYIICSKQNPIMKRNPL